MPSVGDLWVELDARSDEFKSSMVGAGKLLDGFEDNAAVAVAGASASFKKLIGPIVAVGTALAALGATRALASVSAGAVQSAAAFETYEIRLRGLLGSQEGANKAIETFIELSSTTPFAVNEIVEGASTLASVAGGSRNELERLTKTSANIAAQFGINFADAAGNMQRALSSGIAAADRFRDLGVRKIIEDTQKIPNLTKLSLAEQRKAFYDTFGPEAMTPFANAAEDLSKTMGGSLSNIADAAANAKRELGEALAPAVFGVAKGTIIPLFNDLEKLIVDNEKAITKFAVDGIRKLLLGFQNMLSAGADILIFLDQFDIQLRDIPRVLGIVARAFRFFFNSVSLGFQSLATAALILVEVEARRQWFLRQITTEQMEAVSEFRRLSVGFLKETAGKVSEDLEEDLFQIALSLDNAADSGKNWGDELKKAAARTGELAEATGKFTDQFVTDAERRKNARDEEEEALKGPAPELEALAGFEGGLEFDIAQEAALQKRIEGERKKAVARRKKDAQQASKELADLQKETAEGLAADLSGAIGGAFEAILNDEGKSFAEGLADLSGELMEESLERVFQNLEASLAKIFEKMDLSGFFPGEGRGQQIGAAFGVGLGIAGQFFSSQLAGTKERVRGGLVQSAVTSTQQLRGIVAGDVNIPIADVAIALRDMNVQTVTEQKRTNALLTEIRDQRREAGGGPDFAAALVAAIGDELNGPPALG